MITNTTIIEIVNKGLELEEKRRNPPLDDKGFSKHFDVTDKEYLEFLRRHGYLILNYIKTNTH